MDKTEYRSLTDQIRKYAAGKKYKEAAEICDKIDWKKVRDVKMLTAAAEIYAAVGRYSDAVELLAHAYDYAPIGRTIAYRLTELALLANNYEDAKEYFEEYCKVAPKDPRRFLLLYKLGCYDKASCEEKIRILEAYRAEETDEKWEYELASLYVQNHQIEKAVDVCDYIILWFGLGKYVEKAIKLKAKYVELTDDQKVILSRIKEEKESRRYIREKNDIGQIQGVYDHVSAVQVDSLLDETGKETAKAVREMAEDTAAKADEEIDFSAGREQTASIAEAISGNSRSFSQLVAETQERAKKDQDYAERISEQSEEAKKEFDNKNIRLPEGPVSGSVIEEILRAADEEVLRKQADQKTKTDLERENTEKETQKTWRDILEKAKTREAIGYADEIAQEILEIPLAEEETEEEPSVQTLPEDDETETPAEESFAADDEIGGTEESREVSGKELELFPIRDRSAAVKPDPEEKTEDEAEEDADEEDDIADILPEETSDVIDPENDTDSERDTDPEDDAEEIERVKGGSKRKAVSGKFRDGISLLQKRLTKGLKKESRKEKNDTVDEWEDEADTESFAAPFAEEDENEYAPAAEKEHDLTKASKDTVREVSGVTSEAAAVSAEEAAEDEEVEYYEAEKIVFEIPYEDGTYEAAEEEDAEASAKNADSSLIGKIRYRLTHLFEEEDADELSEENEKSGEENSLQGASDSEDWSENEDSEQEAFKNEGFEKEASEYSGPENLDSEKEVPDQERISEAEGSEAEAALGEMPSEKEDRFEKKTADRKENNGTEADPDKWEDLSPAEGSDKEPADSKKTKKADKAAAFTKKLTEGLKSRFQKIAEMNSEEASRGKKKKETASEEEENVSEETEEILPEEKEAILSEAAEEISSEETEEILSEETAEAESMLKESEEEELLPEETADAVQKRPKAQKEKKEKKTAETLSSVRNKIKDFMKRLQETSAEEETDDDDEIGGSPAQPAGPASDLNIGSDQNAETDEVFEKEDVREKVSAWMKRAEEVSEKESFPEETSEKDNAGEEASERVSFEKELSKKKTSDTEAAEELGREISKIIVEEESGDQEKKKMPEMPAFLRKKEADPEKETEEERAEKASLKEKKQREEEAYLKEEKEKEKLLDLLPDLLVSQSIQETEFTDPMSRKEEQQPAKEEEPNEEEQPASEVSAEEDEADTRKKEEKEKKASLKKESDGDEDEEEETFTETRRKKKKKLPVLHPVNGVPVMNPKELRAVWHFAVNVPDGQVPMETAMKYIRLVAEQADRPVPRSVARVTAAQLNGKDLVQSFDNMMNRTIVVINASELESRIIDELERLLEPTDRSLLMVLVDSPKKISRLFAKHPDLSDIFTAQFMRAKYSAAELLKYAKDYADVQDSVLDEGAELLMMEKIDRILESPGQGKKHMVEDVVDRAIEAAEKKTARNLVGLRYDREGCLILRARHFEEV